MEYFYNLGQVSKKLVDKDKRIEEQTSQFLKQHEQNLKEELENKEATKLNETMSNARFSYASSIARSKTKIGKLNEEIKYLNTSSIIGMTEMVSEVVENALLLDESELAKIYPEYKKDIRSIVKGFLTEGDLKPDIKNSETLSLMEYVSNVMPGVREGSTLTEDDLTNYVMLRKPVNIDKSIRNLSGDVASNVALLMEKENQKNEQIKKDVDRAKAKEDKKEKEEKSDEPSADDLMKKLESGQLNEKDIDNMLKDGEISQETYDELVSKYEDATDDKTDMNADMEDSELPDETADDMPMTTSADAPTDDSVDSMDNADSSTSGSPKKQIQMLPDGTLNVNIFESKQLVREVPRSGLIESLAVNEACNMLKEGKEYDGDLCLAKALMYVTITEAMNTMGLMDVNEQKYSQIISAAGGSLKEGKSFTDSIKYGGKNTDNYLNGKEKAMAKAMSKKGESPNTVEAIRQVQEKVREKYENKAAKQALHESIINVQYNVQRNITEPDSIAERIRRKRLNEQQNLNE